MWNKCLSFLLLSQGTHAYLQAALAFLRTIEDASLAHGVAALLWHTFLAKKIEALATTMDKVKKVGRGGGRW